MICSVNWQKRKTSDHSRNHSITGKGGFASRFREVGRKRTWRSFQEHCDGARSGVTNQSRYDATCGALNNVGVFDPLHEFAHDLGPGILGNEPPPEQESSGHALPRHISQSETELDPI